MAPFLATRRLARADDLVTPLRLVVAAAVVGHARRDRCRGRGRVDRHRVAHRGGRADRRHRRRRGARGALALTRELDPEGDHLMATAVVPNLDRLAERRAYVDADRFGRGRGRLLRRHPGRPTPPRAVPGLAADLPDLDAAGRHPHRRRPGPREGRRLEPGLSLEVVYVGNDDSRQSATLDLPLSERGRRRRAHRPAPRLRRRVPARRDVPAQALRRGHQRLQLRPRGLRRAPRAGRRRGPRPHRPRVASPTRGPSAPTRTTASSTTSSTRCAGSRPTGPTASRSRRCPRARRAWCSPRPRLPVPPAVGRRGGPGAARPGQRRAPGRPAGRVRRAAAGRLGRRAHRPHRRVGGVRPHGAERRGPASSPPPTPPTSSSTGWSRRPAPSRARSTTSARRSAPPRGADQARAYALMAAACVLVALLALAAGRGPAPAQLPPRRGRRCACSASGWPPPARAGRAELASLAVLVLLAVAVGGWLAVQLLLGGLPLVTPPAGGPARSTPRPGRWRSSSRPSSPRPPCCVVGGRARVVRDATTRPSLLRDEERR